MGNFPSMGFKRPLVRIQSLGPQSTCLKKQVLCFLYLFPEPAASRAEGAFRSAAARRAGTAGPPAGSNPVTRTKQ